MSDETSARNAQSAGAVTVSEERLAEIVGQAVARAMSDRGAVLGAPGCQCGMTAHEHKCSHERIDAFLDVLAGSQKTVRETVIRVVVTAIIGIFGSGIVYLLWTRIPKP